MVSREFGADGGLAPQEQLLVNAVIKGLADTYCLHESLGDAGRSNMQLNPFGEMALAMDVQAEEAVLAALKDTQLSFQVFSEEHGSFTQGENPQYTVVLDGLDGSDEYKKRRGTSMYGTMTSMLSGINPTYDDYLVSGIMIHSPSPRLFLAIKNQGCFLVDVQTGARSPVDKRLPKQLSPQTPIELDLNWKPFKNLFDKELPFNLACPFFSQAAHTARFLDGTIDVELEWTRKGNLEQAVSYGLVREVGGVMVTPDGVSIGNERFKTFRQEGHYSLIIATDQNLAMAVSQGLNLRSLYT